MKKPDGFAPSWRCDDPTCAAGSGLTARKERRLPALICISLALATSGGAALAQQGTSSSKPARAKGKPAVGADQLLESPLHQPMARFGESVLRSTPSPASLFGVTEDVSTGILYFSSLYLGTIYRFNKDLTPDVITPTMPGVPALMTGIAWDPVADSLWVMDFGAFLARELNKNTGAATGRTLALDPANSTAPGPMTIDPNDPDILVYEDTTTDTFVRVRISTNAILSTFPNPAGAGAFGNGISWGPGRTLDVTAASNGAGGQAMQVYTGNPATNVCGMPLDLLATADVAAATGDSFINDIQYSVDPTLGNAEVWYMVGNATGTIYEVGPIGPRPSNMRRFGGGNVGVGRFSPSLLAPEGFDGIAPGAGSIPAGWATSSTTGNGDWGAAATVNANTPPQACFSSSAPVLKDDRLDTPLLALPLLGGCSRIELHFWHTFGLENGFDGTVLEASLNGGAFADIGHLVIQNPPDTMIVQNSGSPIAGRRAWSGEQLGVMKEVIADLSTLAGSNVVLRWRHADDPAIAVNGYFLDSVSVGVHTGSGRRDVLFVNRAPGPINENFDGIPAGAGSIPAGWATSSPTANGDWGARTQRFHSSPNAMFSTDVATIKDDRLDTPTLDLSGVSEMVFFQAFDLETNFDGGVLEISTDGGASFNDLGQFATENGYTGTLQFKFGNPIGGRAAWSGFTAGFQRVTISIPPSDQLPNSVIRFRLGCDGSVARNGWFVDDVRLIGSSGTGGLNRVVHVPLNTRITVNLDSSACGPAANVPYVLWAWFGSSIDPREQISGGTSVGCAVNRTPINGPPAAPNRFRCLRGSAMPPAACTGWTSLPAPPSAPWQVRRNAGFGSPANFTIQALIRDNGAGNSGGLPFSMTNAVEIQIP